MRRRSTEGNFSQGGRRRCSLIHNIAMAPLPPNPPFPRRHSLLSTISDVSPMVQPRQRHSFRAESHTGMRRRELGS